MMTPHDLFLEAAKRGLRLEAAGDKVAIFPRGRLADYPEFAGILRRHKSDLLVWLSRRPCPGWQVVPPYDQKLDPVHPRPLQEDARNVVDYLTRQVIGSDALCEWCLRRESAYQASYHWPDHVCTYAAARDAACWQLGRKEHQVWELLYGFDSVSPNKNAIGKFLSQQFVTFFTSRE